MGRTRDAAALLADRADHPHARGENTGPQRCTANTRGPSPRAWGEHPQGKCNNYLQRTIPTRVGRTRSRWSRRGRRPDHPHARGENATDLPRAISVTGPSPRAWGEHRRRAAARLKQRTIPTRVGRTGRRFNRRQRRADHPHARGENVTRPRIRPYLSGPSPRAWGEREPTRAKPNWTRTIPTRVGRTR